ncbi:hypothetical protein BGX26_011125 [Mortierella sp. AD094]|nr:hypothetical protein BGX26_011125 [Mortierella sp. AD094]
MERSPATTVLGTPELVELFTLHLSPPDLLSCIQVNSHWHQLFIPALWHTIDDSLYSWNKFIAACFKEPATTKERQDNLFKLLEKYGQHIRHLTIHWDILAEAASVSAVCMNLRSLKMELTRTMFQKQMSIQLKSILRGDLAADEDDVSAFEAHVRFLDQQDSDFSDADNDDDDDVGDDIEDGVDGGDEDGEFDGVSKETKGNGGAEEGGNDEIEEEEEEEDDEDEEEGGEDEDEDEDEHASTDRDTFMETAVPFSDPIHIMFEGVFKAPRTFPGQFYRIPSTREEIEIGWVFTQRYWSLIMANPRLRRLCLSINAAFQWDVQSKDFFYKVLSNLKELKELEASDFLDMACLLNIHKFAPKLEKVTGANLSEEDDNNTPMVSNPAIKSLHVSGRVGTSMLFKILNGFPNLEGLAMAAFVEEEDYDLISRVQILFASSPSGFNLKLLDISNNGYDDDRLVSLFRLLPSLTELRIENVEGRPENDTANQLFVSCPNLKVFNGIERFVNADELIRHPWACHRLEKFRCRIVGVERLNDDEQAIYDKMTATSLQFGSSEYNDKLSERERAVMQKVERSREQQRRVYSRLAGLKDLKHLDMGYENRNPWTYKSVDTYVSSVDGNEYLPYDGPIQDTLELSLESGLHLLAGLKDLEMFGFEAVNHRITKKELDWMAKSWPKLKLMYGLAKDRLYRIEYDREKAELRDYMKCIKPDVGHGTLFRDNI